MNYQLLNGKGSLEIDCGDVLPHKYREPLDIQGTNKMGVYLIPKTILRKIGINPQPENPIAARLHQRTIGQKLRVGFCY